MRRQYRAAVQSQAHDDRVPQLARAAAVVPGQVALALEAEPLVEGDGGAVVGPDLEGDLVGAGRPGLVDPLGEQGAADPATAPGGEHGHAQVGHAVAGQVQAEVARQLAPGLGHQHDRVVALDGLGHGVVALLDVHGGLGGDPAALPGDLGHQGDQGVDVVKGGRADVTEGWPVKPCRAPGNVGDRSSGCSTRPRAGPGRGTSAAVRPRWHGSSRRAARSDSPPRPSSRPG